MEPSLIVASDPGLPIIGLKEGINGIGRAAGNDVLIEGPSIAKAHCQLAWRAGQLTLIRTAGNETRVNGKQAPNHPLESDCILAHGDIIAVGEVHELIVQLPVDETPPDSFRLVLDSGLVLPIPEGTSTLGRSSRATIRLPDPTVSRCHARLLRKEGRVTLTHGSGKNPLRVNGEEIVQRELHDGDRLSFGDLSARFHAPSHLAVEDVPPPRSAILESALTERAGQPHWVLRRTGAMLLFAGVAGLCVLGYAWKRQSAVARPLASSVSKPGQPAPPEDQGQRAADVLNSHLDKLALELDSEELESATHMVTALTLAAEWKQLAAASDPRMATIRQRLAALRQRLAARTLVLRASKQPAPEVDPAARQRLALEKQHKREKERQEKLETQRKARRTIRPLELWVQRIELQASRQELDDASQALAELEQRLARLPRELRSHADSVRAGIARVKQRIAEQQRLSAQTTQLKLIDKPYIRSQMLIQSLQLLVRAHAYQEAKKKLAETKKLATQLEAMPGGKVYAKRVRTQLDSLEQQITKATRPLAPAEIKRAIHAGRTWLASQLQAHGNWTNAGARSRGRLGVNALAVLALLKAGMPASSPTIRRGLAGIRKQITGRVAVYDAALACMMLHALSEAKAPKNTRLRRSTRKVRRRRSWLTSSERGWLRALATRIAVSHNGDGAWGYQLRVPGGSSSKAERRAILYRARTTNYDHSNTQYAILGLRAAEMCGIKVGTAIWRKILEHFLGRQLPSPADDKRPWKAKIQGGGKRLRSPAVEVSGDQPRGWTYREGFRMPVRIRSSSQVAMTCAGLASVIIALEQLEYHRKAKVADRTRSRRAFGDGISWLQTHWFCRAGGQLPGSMVDGYLLYSIERVGVLARIRSIGKVDWYQWGARVLLTSRLQSGKWKGRWGDVVGTSFALLFLKKATLPAEVEITKHHKEERPR